MNPFTYTFNHIVYKASSEPFAEDGYSRYRITLDNDESLIIAPAGWRTIENQTMWVQVEKLGDTPHMHSLVQAIGEGMEENERIIFSKIDELLYYDWNPIGESDIPRNEYEKYIPEILDLKTSGANSDLIAQTLFKIESERIGMPSTIENCKNIAEKIFNL